MSHKLHFLNLLQNQLCQLAKWTIFITTEGTQNKCLEQYILQYKNYKNHKNYKNYKNYEDALIILNLDSLEIRRNDFNLKFTQSGIKNDKLKDLFPLNDKHHKLETRNTGSGATSS